MAKYIRLTNHKGKTFILFGGMYGIYMKIKQACQDANVPIDIIYGWRGEQEQNDLQAKGLSRATFGHSPHNFGLAFDYWPLDNNGAFKKDTDIEQSTWDKVGAIITANGLTWGGSFTNIVDLDHAENTDWRSLYKNGTCPLMKVEPPEDDINNA